MGEKQAAVTSSESSTVRAKLAACAPFSLGLPFVGDHCNGALGLAVAGAHCNGALGLPFAMGDPFGDHCNGAPFGDCTGLSLALPIAAALARGGEDQVPADTGGSLTGGLNGADVNGWDGRGGRGRL